MKKTIILTLAVTLAFNLSAQTADMAVKVSEQQYEGSARTLAMGNAFTALGGDIGALAINPASSGIMRTSSLSISPSINVARGKADYLGISARDNSTRFSMANAGFVWNIDTGRYTGLLNFNIGLSFNRKNNYNNFMSTGGTTRESSMLSSMAHNLYGTNWKELDIEEGKLIGYNPYNNTQLGWPSILAWNTYLLSTIDPATDNEYMSSTENIVPKEDGTYDLYIPGDLKQTFNRNTFGGANEFSINFGSNISDILFLGVNFNFTTVDYTYEENYNETALDSKVFQDGFVQMNHSYWLTVRGMGFDAKFGAILTPVKGLRIGATFTTPTAYRLTDTWCNSMISEFNNGNRFSQKSPTGTYSYKLSSPIRFSVGLAYVFKRGLISFDYERVDYSTAKFRTINNYIETSIELENDAIRQYYTASNIFRAGAEFWCTDKIALRAGYAQYGAPADFETKTQLVSGGIGCKIGNRSSLDFTYQHRLNQDYDFTIYDYDEPCAMKAPTGHVAYSGSRFVLSYSVKF